MLTVRRHEEEYFCTTPAEVASVVRGILRRDPPYNHTHETVNGTEFKTKVKPSGWFRGTEMTIKIQPQYDGTRILADTKSQWFILGDILGFYERYLDDFLREVRMELQRLELQRQGARV
jgi:hypothetical protein